MKYRQLIKNFEQFKREVLSEEALLAEGRLSDVMDQYPGLAEPKIELIQLFSENDPSGNNKYLKWMVEQFIKEHESMPGFKDYMKSVKNRPETTGIKDVFDYFDQPVGEENNFVYDLRNEIQDYAPKMIELVKRFHAYLPTIKGLEKAKKFDVLEPGTMSPLKSYIDINQYSRPVLAKVLNKVGQHIEKKKREKEQKSKEAKQARQESTFVYEDSVVKVVRPLTSKASCYYGKGSTWCIAQIGAKYFEEYTNAGQSFYFIFFEGAPPPKEKEIKRGGTTKKVVAEADYAKVALVIDNQGYGEPTVSEYFNNPDESMSMSDVAEGVMAMWQESGYIEENYSDDVSRSAVLRDIENILESVEQMAIADSEENPPGPDLASYEEILEEAKPEEWSFLRLGVEDFGEGLYFYASMDIDIGRLARIYGQEKNIFLEFNSNYKNWDEERARELFYDVVDRWVQNNGRLDDYYLRFEFDGNEKLLTSPKRLDLVGQFEMGKYDISEWEEVVRDFMVTDSELYKYWRELFEEEEYFNVYEKDEKHETEIQFFKINKKKSEYFPGGPEAEKDQLSLPLSEVMKRWKKFIK